MKKVILLGNRCLSKYVFNFLHAMPDVKLMVVLNPDDNGEEYLGCDSLQELVRQTDCNYLKPAKLDTDDIIALFKDFDPELCISCSYANLIKKRTLSIPSKAFLNFHYALLPKNQGCLPIVWGIASCAEDIGVTLHHISIGIDDGDIIMQKKIKVKEGTTALQLNRACADLGIEMFKKFWNDFERDIDLPRTPQDMNFRTYHKLIHPFKRWIPWHLDSKKVAAVINALTFPPHPAGRTLLNEKEINILGPARSCDALKNLDPGHFRVIHGKTFVACGQGTIQFSNVKIGEAIVDPACCLDSDGVFISYKTEEYSL